MKVGISFPTPPSSKAPVFRRGRARGFTLIEVMVSMGASMIVLGALVMSSISLRRGLQSNATYAHAYSDQRRVTDYIGRDLRRAVAMVVTDEAGQRTEIGGTPVTVTIADRASLSVTLPAYYRSNERHDAEYDAPLEVVADEKRLDYGTSEGLAPPVVVSFRRIYYASEGCVCFIREEAGTAEVIVRHAENLNVQVAVAQDGQTASIKTWFRNPTLGPSPLVSTYDRVLLRNPPMQYQP
jgi:hypothetical protein